MPDGTATPGEREPDGLADAAYDAHRHHAHPLAALAERFPHADADVLRAALSRARRLDATAYDIAEHDLEAGLDTLDASLRDACPGFGDASYRAAAGLAYRLARW